MRGLLRNDLNAEQSVEAMIIGLWKFLAHMKALNAGG